MKLPEYAPKLQLTNPVSSHTGFLAQRARCESEHVNVPVILSLKMSRSLHDNITKNTRVIVKVSSRKLNNRLRILHENSTTVHKYLQKLLQRGSSLNQKRPTAVKTKIARQNASVNPARRPHFYKKNFTDCKHFPSTTTTTVKISSRNVNNPSPTFLQDQQPSRSLHKTLP